MSEPLFRRRCRVTVGDVGITGLRVQFQVEKTLVPEPNSLDLTISNLKEETRRRIQTTGVAVVLEAGYAEKTEQIFKGDCRFVTHSPTGPEWRTRVQSGDGELAFKQSRIHESFAPGVDPKAVAAKVMESMKLEMRDAAVKVAQGDWQGAQAQFWHGMSASGKSHQVLTDLLESYGYSWSIQDGVLQVLGRGQTTDEPAIVLGPRTGLVGSPELGNEGYVKLRCLLQGGIRPGRRLILDTSAFKGAFRADKVIHQGDTHGAEWFTEVEAWAL